MAAVNLPTLGIPAWAQEISDDQWKDMVQQTLQSRQSSAGLRLERKWNRFKSLISPTAQTWNRASDISNKSKGIHHFSCGLYKLWTEIVEMEI